MVDLNIELPDSFFEEEVRCGYTVTKEMKKVWAVELDLLNEFARVCEKHGLRYCLGAGTLLGAVRHKGFIPWDDDIDVYMLRPDYDKLMTLADEFKTPYFLQNSYTEKHLFKTHSRLRNSETSGYTGIEKKLKINKGIFMDIFPLDGVDDNAPEAKHQADVNRRLMKLLIKYNGTYSVEPLSAAQRLNRIVKRAAFTILGKERLVKALDENMKMFSDSENIMWGNRTLVFGCPKSRRPYSEWVDLIDADFEMLKVKIPRSYDGMLRQQYGNYMEFPKNKKGGSIHGELVLDPDTPYYKKENK